MRIQYAIPEGAVSKDILDAALETSTRANHHLIESGAMPLATDEIQRGRVKWRPEKFGDGEHFDLGHQVVARGWGDCDDLAPWLAGTLRATGQDPGACAIAKRTGPKRWHAIVQTSTGKLLDPSEWAGMREYKREHGIHGAINGPLVRPGRGAIGFKRYGRRIAARADLPIEGCDMHVSGVCVGDDLEEVIRRAADTALAMDRWSDAVDPEVARRLELLKHALSGDVDEDDFDDLEESEMGFLGMALPLAGTALNMASSLIPGLGGGDKKPAGGAAPAAGPVPGGAPPFAAQPSHGGEPVTVTPYNGAPGAPIIVRF